jgi:hypothetical protein
MDKKQLVTIAVTALISVVAKEAVTWLLSLAKSQTLKSVIREKAKSTLTKNLLSLTWYLIGFSSSLWLLITDIHKQGPVTRRDVLDILLASFGTFFMGSFLIGYGAYAIFQRSLYRKLAGAKTTEEKMALIEKL